MYLTSIKFTTALEWFLKSSYQYLLLFAAGADESDYQTVEYFLKNKALIDRQTGRLVCFLHFVEREQADFHGAKIIQAEHHEAVENFMLYHIKTEEAIELTRRELYHGVGLEATYQTTEDLCAYFGISRYELPALILVHNGFHQPPIDSFKKQHSLFTIKDVQDVKSFFIPIKLADDLNADYKHIADELSEVQREPTEVEIQQSIQSIEAGIERVSNTGKDDLVDSLNRVLSEVNSTLGEFGITQQLTLVRPYDFKKFLIQNGIVKDYMIPHSDLFSTYKKLYYKVLKWDDNKAARIAKLQSELSSKKEQLTKARTKDTRIQALKDRLSSLLELYQKRFEEALLMEDASALVTSITRSSSALPELLENTIKTFMHKKELINTLVNRIREKVRERQFDVFISCKSQDYEEGEKVYAFLKSRGYKPFIASKSLREIGEAQYSPVISEVVDVCNHMIVFASNLDYVEAPYVQSEWSMFCNEEKAGRKNGKLLTIIEDPRMGVSLPIDLRSREVLPIHGYEDSLCSYLH